MFSLGVLFYVLARFVGEESLCAGFFPVHTRLSACFGGSLFCLQFAKGLI